VKLGEKEQVFKVHWAEKLKMVFKLIYIPALLFWGWRFSLDFSINEIFFKCFLTVLLSIILFLILSIFVFNKKIEVFDNILTYYERGKEVWCRRIGKDNVRIFNENNLFYGNVKYLSIDYCYLVISLFGKKNCLKLEKIIYEFQLEKEEIENTVFEIPKKELLVEKCKNIFKNDAIKIIIVLIVIKYSDNIFLNYFLIIIILGAIILQIVSLIRMKIYTPKIIKIFSNFISIDYEKYSKYNIKKLMITSPNTKSGTIDFGYRILKIFGNNEKKVYTLITSKNSEFKNSGKDEDYETFYEEILKFCIVNGIEYELV
jgi:putative membrane protein